MASRSIEHRKHQRLRPENTFVINQRCVCRVFDISKGGLSFGCAREREVPDIMAIDIIDNSGLQVYNIPVETIWSGKNRDSNTESVYTMAIGVKFDTRGDSDQQGKLNQLLRLIEKQAS